MYTLIAHFVATVHLTMITINLISIPYLIIYYPVFIWMPIISMLISPVIGGTYCMLNNLENHFRALAGKPLIQDRLSHLITGK